MTPMHEEVFRAALSLPAEERAALADRLLESLDPQEQDEIDAAWADEAERRLLAYDKGELKSVPMEEVFRRLSKQDGG